MSSAEEAEKAIVYENVWPNDDVPNIEHAFKDLGCFINSVAVEVAKNLDLYVSAREPSYDPKLERIIRDSPKVLGRLLHYFPVD